MNDSLAAIALSPTEVREIDSTCDCFEAAWKARGSPQPADFLILDTEPARSVLLRHLLILDWHYRRRAGDNPLPVDYHERFPSDTAVIEDVGREMSEARISTRIEVANIDALDTPWSNDADRASPPNGDIGSDFSPERYDLVDEVGHGGIGVVYRGRDRRLGRDLAVKVLREEYRDQPDARRRFISEARIGSQLQHPAIVPVYELGKSADGRPFFTMKLVEGHTLAGLLHDRPQITDRVLPADLPRLLTIYEQVCQAMAYAHSKGVVHRDLKPANVMVGAFGEVQVMDWGFAKVLGDDTAPLPNDDASPIDNQQSGATQSGALMGTPAYMAPEQARGHTGLVDQRADVFALGAILCEILTGQSPYGDGPAEEICRLAAAGEIRDTRARLEACVVEPALRDLAIRCLAPDLTARPTDAGVVAREMTAYLSSAQDRLRQAQMERAAADARANADRRARRFAVGLAATLLIGASVAGWQATVAFAAKHRAETAATAETAAKVTAQSKEAESRSVLAFFRDYVLEAVRPKDEEGGLGKDATIRDALDKSEPKITNAFAGQPVAEAYIRKTLGLSYWHLGEYELARKQTQKALDLNRQFLGPEHSETLGTMNNLGIVFYALGHWAEARDLHDETLKLRRRLLGPEHSDTIASMLNLANTLRALRQLDEARILAEETLALQRRVLGPEHRHTLTTMNSLAGVMLDQGQLKKSRRLFDETLQLRRRTLGPEHPNTLVTLNALGTVLYSLDQKEEARRVYEETLDIERRVLSTDHPDTLRTMYNLANTLAELDHNAEAIPLYRQTLEIQSRVLSPEHFKTLRTMSALSQVLSDEGHLDEAHKLCEESLRLRTKVLKPEHPDTLISMHLLASVMYRQGQIAEAQNLFERTISLRRKVLKPGHRLTLRSQNSLAWLLANSPDPKFRDMSRAIEIAKGVIELAPKDGEKWTTLGVAYYRAGLWKDAIASLAHSETLSGGEHLGINALVLGMAHWQLNEKEKARDWYATATERTAKFKSHNPDLSRVRAEAAALIDERQP